MELALLETIKRLQTVFQQLLEILMFDFPYRINYYKPPYTMDGPKSLKRDLEARLVQYTVYFIRVVIS